MTDVKNAASAAPAKPCPIDLNDSHKGKAAVLSKVLMEHMRSTARLLSYDGTFFGKDVDRDDIVDLACAHAALEEIIDEVDKLQGHVRSLQDHLEEATDQVAEMDEEHVSLRRLIDRANGLLTDPSMSVQDVAKLCGRSPDDIRYLYRTLTGVKNLKLDTLDLQTFIRGLVAERNRLVAAAQKDRKDFIARGKAAMAGLVAPDEDLEDKIKRLKIELAAAQIEKTGATYVPAADYDFVEPAPGTNPEAIAHAKLSMKHSFEQKATQVAPVAKTFAARLAHIYLQMSDDKIIKLYGSAEDLDAIKAAAGKIGWEL